MRKLLALTILLTLGMVSTVWADGMQRVVGPTTRAPQWTVTVFNDHGGEIVSGQMVSWDDDDTNFSTSEYPYVHLTAAADDPYVAGVVAPGLTCADQTMCEIVVRGPITMWIADSTDNATVDTLVAGSTVAGYAGDFGGSANGCYLGILVDVASGDGTDNALGTVFVQPGCL